MKTLLKYLKEYHIDIYSMLLESSLKNDDTAFYYDYKTKKLFEYSIADIQDYYQQKNIIYNENPFQYALISLYIYDVNNFNIKVYHNYNNFLSIKKMKKLLNKDLWYKKQIKEYLRDDIKKEVNRDKQKNLCNLLFEL